VGNSKTATSALASFAQPDEEAALIVTETNLIQRSFADLRHNERAIALKFHLEALKNQGGQGRRNDILNEVKNLINPHDNAKNSTLSQFGTKLRNDEKVGEKYGLSKNTIARYIRLLHLLEELMVRVDDEEIPFMARVNLSYLSKDEQMILENFIFLGKHKIDLKKSREASLTIRAKKRQVR